MAIAQSVVTGNAFAGRAISKDFLLNFFSKGELQVSRKFYDNMPEQIETWFHGRVTHKRALLFVVLTFISTLVVSGIIEGEVYDIWSHAIVPWLGKRSFLTHSELIVAIMGWVFFFLAFVVLFAIYGASRHRIGQLETITQQNQQREQEAIQFNVQINELSHELTQLKSEIAQREEYHTKFAPELEQLRREAKLLELIRNTDRELFIMFTQLGLTEDKMQIYIEGIFRRMFELWGMDKVRRGGIYLPDENDAEFLTIKWDYALGAASLRWDRWYIGNQDPTGRNLYRGIAGIVYMKGVDRVIVDVEQDPDYVDLHQPKRTALPYRSSVHALIHPDDTRMKLGVLSLDSMNYVFTPHDLTLVQQAATRIGWLIQTAYTRKVQE